MANDEQHSNIPKLDIEKFTFFPPGPMGWSISEYESLLENPGQEVQNESSVNEKLVSFEETELVALPIEGRTDSGPRNQVETQEESSKYSKQDEEQIDGRRDLEMDLEQGELEQEELEPTEPEEEVLEEEDPDLIIVPNELMMRPWFSVKIKRIS
jgi:hypothetical protein